VTRATIGGLLSLCVWALNVALALAILGMAGWVVVKFVVR
jgi:hypothetical protein